MRQKKPRTKRDVESLIRQSLGKTTADAILKVIAKLEEKHASTREMREAVEKYIAAHIATVSKGIADPVIWEWRHRG